MYVSSANECWALDAGSGRLIWHYQRARTKGVAGNAAIGFNRGVAWAGDRIFMLTDNAHLIALNRFNGELLWETEMADWHLNYNGTSAPLVVGNLVISGTAGGDEGARGFVAAYDQSTGKEVWRFWTVPQPGEPGSETWKGKDVEHRSGATWMTGTYDPESDTLYLAGRQSRSGFRWRRTRGRQSLHRFDPRARSEDRQAQMVFPVHAARHSRLGCAGAAGAGGCQLARPAAQAAAAGQSQRILLRAGSHQRPAAARQAVLEETELGRRHRQGWPSDFEDASRNAGGETYVCPGFQGGTNWFSTSFNPNTGLYYFQALERCNLFSKNHGEWQAGKGYMGGVARPAPGETFEKVLRAINIQTGEIAWEVPQTSGPVTASAGVLSTASGLVFFGENSGAFMAADATNGTILWQFPTNQVWKASPMTYQFDNKQYVAIAAGIGIIAFGLPNGTRPGGGAIVAAPAECPRLSIEFEINACTP